MWKILFANRMNEVMMSAIADLLSFNFLKDFKMIIS